MFPPRRRNRTPTAGAESHPGRKESPKKRKSKKREKKERNGKN